MAMIGTSEARIAPADMRSRTWWTALLYIAAVAMLLRFYDLPLKPLHHDEGVNTLILTKLVDPPHVYRYDPANYHGPTLFYFGWLSTAVLGVTTVAIRTVTATTGLALVLLVLGLRRQLGAVGVLSASALLALSPGAVYFSRYFIHEMPLVCFTVAVVVFAANWLQNGRAVTLIAAAAAAALMLATKETALISAVVLAGAAVAACVLVSRTPAQAIRLFGRVRKPALATALGATSVFFAVALLFYTSIFTHWDGAVDAVRAFAFWTKTGTSAHTHSWSSYAEWLRAEELPILLLGCTGVLLAFWRRDSLFAVFAALWALGMFAAYSAIPYKTPWLTLNILLPLAITGGYACERAGRCRPRRLRIASSVAFAALLCLSTCQSVILNFIEYDREKHPYVYAHTDRDVLRLVDQVQQVESRHPRSSIAVTSADHFPLSWYLREFPSGYYGRELITGDPLVIASFRQKAFFDRSLGRGYREVGLYRLRPGVRLVLYVRRELLP